MTAKKTPKGLTGPGLILWKATLEEFDLSPHATALLEELCRVRTRIAELDAVVAAEGIMSSSSQGARVHPALTETRQQRMLFQKLIGQLGIPGDDP